MGEIITSLPYSEEDFVYGHFRHLSIGSFSLGSWTYRHLVDNDILFLSVSYANLSINCR